uniref:Uncharacterized protein n=1 Tax=Anguilla anguilla TaxID=7936 RepID=A0A0E9V6K7_ANGAN
MDGIMNSGKGSGKPCRVPCIMTGIRQNTN